jgi:hypothetical protein
MAFLLFTAFSPNCYGLLDKKQRTKNHVCIWFRPKKSELFGKSHAGHIISPVLVAVVVVRRRVVLSSLLCPCCAIYNNGDIFVQQCGIEMRDSPVAKKRIRKRWSYTVPEPGMLFTLWSAKRVKDFNRFVNS